MAVKQNGVLATFTPTNSQYTNRVVPGNSNAISATSWMMYTCPQNTLVSGKLFVSNNTGGSLNIEVGIVEYTDGIQLDVPGNQPGSPQNFGAFNFPSGTSSNYASSIKAEHSAVTNGPFVNGETVTWVNPALTPLNENNCSAIVHYADTGNNILWLRNLSHPLGLQVTAQGSNTAVDATFTGGTSGASASIGPSHAGTNGNVGWSGHLRFYDSLKGTLYLQNYEFRNNINYSFLYANDNNENRVQNNNNMNRSLARIWRPVETTTKEYNNAAQLSNPNTTFVDSQGNACLVASVSQCFPEQFIVQDYPIADGSFQEISGIVLGEYQSIYVKSTGAVTFTLVGFEEAAEALS